MRTWVAVVTFCVLGALAPREAVPKEQKGQRDGLPHMAGASLLIGVPPYFLVVNNPHENIRLQPEYSQPYPRNGGAIYPSISRDGKTIAYARVKSIEHGRVVAISTYSVTTDKHTDYSEGECSGSVAISPDASRLAFPPARPMMGVGDDNSLHIIDLKTGRETLGPEVSRSNWPVFISWSPDSRRLAYSVTGKIRVWDSDTGKVSEIAEGDVPAWSPSGEWIVYLQGTWEAALNRVVFEPGRWGRRCLVVHPDGTGGKTLIDLPQTKKFAAILVEPPVWSPDSSSILLNEMWNVDTGTANVLIFDLKTMKLRTEFHDSLRVIGWAEAN